MGNATRLGVFAAGLAVVLSAAAYEYPVRDYSVRDAYFLGRRKDEKTATFLSQYVKRFSLPSRGPHIAEIELRTPYQLVVLRARNAPDGYSSQQAAQEYRAASDTVVVRVLIYLTPTYPAHTPLHLVQVEPVQLRAEDFWREFAFGLYQQGEIEPRKVTGRPIYGSSEPGLPGLTGAEVELEFKASDLIEAPARVVVVAPTRQRVEAEFDLAKLR